MKRHFIYSLAATFITAALTLDTLTACSNEDSVAEGMQDGATAAAPLVYSVNIAAKLGDEGTRAVTYNDVTGGLTSTFRTTDNITVDNRTKDCTAINDGGEYMYLHADANAKKANLVGNLTFYNLNNSLKAVEVDDELLLMYNASSCYFKYNTDGDMGQKGTLASLSDYDYAKAEVKITGISGAGTAESPYTLTTTDALFTNVQSMFKLTFTGMPEDFIDDPSSHGINKITIHSTKDKLSQSYMPYDNDDDCCDIEISLGGEGGNPTLAREANGAGNVVYAALRFLPLGDGETDEITFTIETTEKDENDENIIYIAKKTSPVGGFQNGKYYTSTIEAYPKNVNLASINANFTARDGQVLTGALDGDYQIFIADGATVTLDGAHITCLGIGAKYAGITCLGDATILLSGTNYLKGGLDDDSGIIGLGEWPGIFVPANKTLTIDGAGSLDARSGGIDEEKKAAPGIGAIAGDAYSGEACGNIVIKGGTITTIGAGVSAGIGGSYKYGCGYITITGSASVTATGGFEGGAGIGGGFDSSCGDITISTSGSVTATSYYGGAGIGCGPVSTCGNITINTTGTVTATGGYMAAGIGAGSTESESGTNQCGNITICGSGTIIAMGGYNAAGIGSGTNAGGSSKSQCGNILISGGTVTATGVYMAAGIGTGFGLAQCGDVTITNGVTSVTATKGDGAINSIGPSRYSSNRVICGTVKFGTATMFDGSSWTPTDGPTHGSTYGGLRFTKSTTIISNDTWTLTPVTQ